MSARFLLASTFALLAAGQPVIELGPRVVATIADPAVTESSGVVASRSKPGIYWTHNDSGDGPVLYAFDRSGRSYGRWTVPGAVNVDWEDIAGAPGGAEGRWNLYVGDIGDNLRQRREIVVYRIEEPAIGEAEKCKPGCRTKAATAYRLRYPDGPHNAETLLVHPVTKDIYVVTKAGTGDPETTVFVARAGRLGKNVVTLSAVAKLDIPDALTRTLAGGITGGEISAGGNKVALCDYLHYYEASLPAGAPFDDIWKLKFTSNLTGVVGQVEGICYRLDGKAFILTAEGKPSPVIEIPIE